MPRASSADIDRRPIISRRLNGRIFKRNAVPPLSQSVVPRTRFLRSRGPPPDPSGAMILPQTDSLDYCRRVLPGTYVAFELDMDWISNKFPVNSPARSFLSRLRMRPHVGLVTKSSVVLLTGMRLAELLEVRYVAGMPPSVRGIGDHYMMVGPTTVATRGPPLRTTLPLPFQDATQCTTIGIKLLVTRLYGSSTRFALEGDELDRFAQQVIIDEADLQHKVQTWSTTELETLGKYHIPRAHVPVKIWRDVRLVQQLQNEPMSFINELAFVENWCRFCKSRIDQGRTAGVVQSVPALLPAAAPSLGDNREEASSYP